MLQERAAPLAPSNPEANGHANAQDAADAPAPLTSQQGSMVTTYISAPVVQATGLDVVLGVPIEDDGMKKVVRRVIVLAAIGASFYIVHFIGNLMSGVYDERNSKTAGSLWTAMSSLLIELSIPACGYYGALHGNRQLMCCFCSCNLFVTVVGIVSFIRLNVRIVELDGDCAKEENSQHRRTCEVWVDSNAEKYLMIASVISGTCLGTIAFWVGSSLYQRLANEVMRFGQVGPPLVGEIISLTPAASGTSGNVTSIQRMIAEHSLQTNAGLASATATATVVVAPLPASTPPPSIPTEEQRPSIQAANVSTPDGAHTPGQLQYNTVARVVTPPGVMSGVMSSPMQPPTTVIVYSTPRVA